MLKIARFGNGVVRVIDVRQKPKKIYTFDNETDFKTWYASNVQVNPNHPL